MGKRKRPAPLIVKEVSKSPKCLVEPSIEDRLEAADCHISEILELLKVLKKIINKDWVK